MEGKYPTEEPMPGCEARGERYPAEQQKENGAAVLARNCRRLDTIQEAKKQIKTKVVEANHHLQGRSVQKAGPPRRSIKGRSIRSTQGDGEKEEKEKHLLTPIDKLA